MTIPITNPQALGRLLRAARQAKHLSIRDVAEQSRVSRSALFELEQGKIASPNPVALASLADLLGLRLPDLYAAAGYTPSKELPAFTPYLRSKYRDLPDQAQAELTRSFEHIAKKYGYVAEGPSAGQDE